ncbi:MAG: spermidine/putrescine ABC transporter substrate-binding protein [Candidatus Altiarchaeota archaeon]|nr:spermidine/putrescine ABC transporter substrate-binding protein [Candidatus Altiarchaeota archaeon]
MRTTSALLLAVCVLATAGCLAATEEKRTLSPVLEVYNWEDYIDPEAVADFEKEFNVKVHITTFSDEEEMYASVQSDPGRYDIVVLTGELADYMAQSKLIAELDLSNIPNVGKVRSEIAMHDPASMYSIPYLWGTTGIIVNRDYIRENVTWKTLWNPYYRGKLGMLNNRREVIGAALKMLGYSLSSTDPNQLAEARAKLVEQKTYIKGYIDPGVLQEMMLSGDLWAAQMYSGDAIIIVDNESGMNLEYVIPPEGGSLWVDRFAIPRDSPHKYTAELFIDFMTRPENSARNAVYSGFASPIANAEDYMNESFAGDVRIYPPNEVLDKCERFEDIGNANSIYNEIWSEINQE